jgi:hypothetical protein
LVTPPLLELFVRGRGLAAQAVAGVVTGDAGGVVALIIGGEADVVVVDAVNVEQRQLLPPRQYFRSSAPAMFTLAYSNVMAPVGLITWARFR